jgi:hypothetical protein
MIWNFSRFKIFMLGCWGILCIIGIGIPTVQALHVFQPFEIIVLCYCVLFLVFVSLFPFWYGLEPIMFDLKWGKDRV